MEGLRERWAQDVPRKIDKSYVPAGSHHMATISTLFRWGWITLWGRRGISNQNLSIPWPATAWTVITGRYQSWTFQSEKHYYEAHVSAFLEHVKYLQLGHHCFFAPIPARSEYNDYAGFRKASDGWSDFVTVQSKINSSENRSDYVIAGEVLSEITTRRTNDVSNTLLNDR